MRTPVVAGLGLAALALAAPPLTACSSGGGLTPSESSASPSGSASSSSGTPSESASPSPSDSPTKLLAVLCDKATPETTKVIEAAMNKGFTVSQLSDVRTDDAGAHAVLGFVQGPGLSVLAIWTGTGLKLDGLAAADEFASQASNVPMGTPTPELKDLVGQTAKCYQALYAPKKDNKDNKKQ